jgi:hypothetical protein
VWERRKISRLDRIQEFLLRRQQSARYGDGVPIVAAKQFGHRALISIPGLRDQVRFRFFASIVGGMSHIELRWPAHVAFHRWE